MIVCDKCKRPLRQSYYELIDKEMTYKTLFQICEDCFESVDDFIKKGGK